MEVTAKILAALAALTMAALPAAVLFWLLIHPFASFWRRLGPLASYVVVSAICLGAVAAIWMLRGPLMRYHLGYHPVTIGVGAALLAAGAAWDWKVIRKLELPVLAGLPELSVGSPARLVTDGPYAVVRHPRYLGAMIGLVGFSLICNYPWLYAIVASSAVLGWVMVVLEERELEQRFGTEYRDYRRRVPRFLPRWGGTRLDSTAEGRNG